MESQKTPKFNNRPADHVIYQFISPSSGVKIHQDFFVGRATAVVGVVFALDAEGYIHVLITRRSDKMRDEPGKYGVPCGYADWDETLYEAVVREIYEETSLYLPDYEDFLDFDNGKRAFEIKDDPKADKRQNISHIYGMFYNFSKNMDKFPLSIENFTCRETAMVKWIRLADFYGQYKQEYQWAFNHDETINSAIKYYRR